MTLVDVSKRSATLFKLKTIQPQQKNKVSNFQLK